MYRRRSRSTSRNTSPTGILLADFKFHNKTKHILKEEVYDDIVKKLLKYKKDIYWTSRTFLKGRIGFQFFFDEYYSDGKEIKEASVNIVELEDNAKIKVSQFNTCKYSYRRTFFFGCTLTEDQEKFLSNLFYANMRVGKVKTPYFDSWEEFIEYIIVNNLIPFEYDYYQDYKEAMRDMFKISTSGVKVRYDKVSKRRSNSSTYVFHIQQVIERRINNTNYRVAIGAIPQKGYSEDNYFAWVIKEDSKYYTLIDEGRFFFGSSIASDGDFYFLDEGLVVADEKGKYTIQKDVFDIIRENAETVLGVNLVVTNRVWRFYHDRYSLVNIGKGELGDRIIQKYKQVLAEDRPIKIGVLKLSNTSIQIMDQDFKLEFKKPFLNVSNNLYEIKNIVEDNDIRYNVNELFKKILHLSKVRIIDMDRTKDYDYKELTHISFTFNDMKIVIKKVNNRININGFFCRIADIHEILNRIICYTDVNEFNKYVKDVSYIGHDWKVLIGNGVQISLRNPLSRVMKKITGEGEENTHLRFSFIWDTKRRTKIYVVVNSNRYEIKKKGRFKHHFNRPSISLSMRLLRLHLLECIPSLNDDNLIAIVEDAIKEGEIIRKRAKELVDNTVKDIEAKEVELEIRGSKYKGFIFVGKASKSEYFVDKNDLAVFKKVNGEWNRRCVVNDYNKNRIFEDWLANRLVNVYNEPTYIYTLHNI